MTRASIRSLAVLVLAVLPASHLAAQCPMLWLTAGNPQSTTCSPTQFSLVPIAGHWNAVGVRGLTDWNMTLPPAISVAPGLLQDFALSNGHAGSPPVTSGVVNVLGPPLPGTLQQAVIVPMQVNAPMSDTIPANDGLRLYEFNVPAAGNYTVVASSTGPFAWALFAPTPNADWISRANQLVSAPANSPITLSLTQGWHALVVFREGYAAATQAAVTVSVTCGATPIVPANGSTVSISQPCQYFTVQPWQAHWNVVAITSASDWSVKIGGAASLSSGSACDALVANGHDGTVASGDATFHRMSGPSSASAVFASAIHLPMGAQAATPWTSSTVAHLYEFNVTSAGYYGVTITAPGGLAAEVLPADGSAVWRDRGALSIPTPTNATTSVSLPVGWHAILVSRSNGVGSSGTATVQVAPLPNPLPTISGFSPSTVAAGGGQPLALTVNGSGFVPTSVVRWAGEILPTTYVSGVQLGTTVPASLLAQSGLVPVSVASAPPGGGTSASTLYPVFGPSISSLSPAGLAAPINTPFGAQLVGLLGSGFLPGAQVYADGTPVIVVSNSGTQLQVLLPHNLPAMGVPGGIAINVMNGTAMSNTVGFHVGGAPNQGTVTFNPPAPAAGSTVSLDVETGAAGQPLTLVASNPLPSTWTYAGLLVGIDLQSVFPIADGLGLFGPADGTTIGVAGHPQRSVFRIGGLTLPNPPIGATVEIQAVRPAPGSAAGITLTWPRTLTY
jgi:hypothetical protein